MSKAKKLLFTVIGVILALVSLLLILSFVVTVASPHMPFQKNISKAGGVLMWMVILVTGTFATLLLLKAWKKPAAAMKEKSVDLPGDYDDPDAVG
jgi:hypothetical protein